MQLQLPVVVESLAAVSAAFVQLPVAAAVAEAVAAVQLPVVVELTAVPVDVVKLPVDIAVDPAVVVHLLADTHVSGAAAVASVVHLLVVAGETPVAGVELPAVEVQVVAAKVPKLLWQQWQSCLLQKCPSTWRKWQVLLSRRRHKKLLLKWYSFLLWLGLLLHKWPLQLQCTCMLFLLWLLLLLHQLWLLLLQL